MAEFTEMITDIVAGFWSTVAEMSPYLLFGFFVAGLLSVFLSPAIVERHLGGKGIWPLLKASLFGIPLPLCSCGVIPVSMSLRKHGASKGATVSFLLSTPQTGADSILVTFSLLGPIYAVFRPVAALITGLLGGGLVSMQDSHSQEKQPEECSDSCCDKADKTHIISKIFRHGFITLPRDIGRAMFAGLVIAALIAAVVPADFFGPLLGGGIFAMILMMLMGIPVYVCATASVPVAAALIAKGVSPGAAMVFLMTGPATNAAAFTTIWSTLGRRTAITYILTVAGCAIASGVILDQIVQTGVFSTVHEHGWMLPPAARNICAIVLLAVLGFGAIKKKNNSAD